MTEQNTNTIRLARASARDMMRGENQEVVLISLWRELNDHQIELKQN